MEKPMVIEYNKRKFTWHKGIWTQNNLVVSTDLAQKLTKYCLDNKILKQEDFANGKSENKE